MQKKNAGIARNFALKGLLLLAALTLSIGFFACKVAVGGGEGVGTEVPEVTLTFDAGEGSFKDGKTTLTLTGKAGEAFTLTESPERVGYSFKEWNPALPEKYPEKDTEYTAVWVKEGDYTITYELDGGTNAEENPASYNVESETITLKDPAKPGYTFAGWYMAEDFTGNAVTEIAQGTTGNITLYAKWVKEGDYTITYVNVDGATNENPASYNVETETITLKDPAKAGYTFEGWYKDGEFTTQVTEIPQGSTGNITLYAKWFENYTITYELDGGTNASENPAGYNEETETITLKDPVKPGYTFGGWYKDGEFTTQVTEITQGSTGDMTLYAKWLENYTITYALDGGTNASENPASYNVETGTITLKAPTKDKYDFKGWYKDGEFTTQVTEIPQGSTGNITLYAKWEPVSYTITYVNVDGATNENPESYNVETETITLKDPVKTGYTFAGWYTAGNSPVTKIKNGSTGNITLYAKWVTDIEGKVFVRGGDATLNGKEVTLSSFWISPYEVTQYEYLEVMLDYDEKGYNSMPSSFSGDYNPVESVSWYDAIVYCNFLSMKENLTPCYTIKNSTNPIDWGIPPDSKEAEDYNAWAMVTCDFNANGYRLPTETEWEYAARGGQPGITDGSWNYDYSGSNTADDVAWYSSNSDSKTHEVGKKKANALGLYDMSGNVFEWCWDWIDDNIYPTGNTDPIGNDSGTQRVLRGGSWMYISNYSKVSYRFSQPPTTDFNNCGFRVVRSAR